MEGRITKKVLFIFWTILSIQSMVWIIFNILNLGLLFREFTFQFVFILSCLSFLVSVISIKDLISDVNDILKEEKNKQKNVKDVYTYNQLLDPPDTNMYN